MRVKGSVGIVSKKQKKKSVLLRSPEPKRLEIIMKKKRGGFEGIGVRV